MVLCVAILNRSCLSHLSILPYRRWHSAIDQSFTRTSTTGAHVNTKTILLLYILVILLKHFSCSADAF